MSSPPTEEIHADADVASAGGEGLASVEPPRPGGLARIVVLVGVAVVALALVALSLRASSRTNKVALADAPKPVTVEEARAGQFQEVRTYVGTAQPWNSAKVGPQYVSAYVGAVLVRPGATVKRGEVLATLDCRNAAAASKEIAAKAKALEERQAAVEHEAGRVKELSQGGFASQNETEQLAARAASDKAEVESLRASLVSRSLEVDDCILRAPFPAEVAERFVDPGAYVRPGNPVVTVIDRSLVRVTADVPESDFAVVAPDRPVALLVEATGAKLSARVSRRAPAADEATRTVHFEVDVPNLRTLPDGKSERVIPVGTTVRVSIDVGAPRPASLVPLRSAVLRGGQATLFTVEEGQVARKRSWPVLGEAGGTLYVDPSLAGGTPVVTEGRALLADGDKVTAKEAAAPPPSAPPPAPTTKEPTK